jgi:hypothetical protein
MPEPQYALTEIPPEQLSQLPKQGIVTIAGKRYQVQLVIPPPQAITQQPEAPRPSHYQTAKSRGIQPQPLPIPKPPGILPLTLSAVIALSFLVAASMFSIGLTSYSNSVDRVDRTRSFIHVE